MTSAMRRTVERWLVILIAAHSLGVMVLLTFLPRLTVQLGGYGSIEDVFFVRQGGIFHLVVATVYLGEYFRYGRTTSIVFAKAVAVVFLSWTLLFLDAPYLVALALLGDLTMGVLAYVVGRWARPSEAVAPIEATASAAAGGIKRR